MIVTRPTIESSFIITLGVMTAIAALTVDISLPAVPSMVVDLAASLSKGQQIVGIFVAGMAFGQIPAGLVSDRVGRLPVLYAGMTLFAVAAIAAALAESIELMLLARFSQGIGAAAAMVLARAIVRDIASGKEAARLMSLMTMIFTAAPVIAPTFGALLVAHWGWRAPFVAIAMLGVMILIAIRVNIHETHSGNAVGHPVRQLLSSFSEFFSHRQSIFGLLLLIIPPAGYMSIIALAASLVVKTYGYSITDFGYIFATAGGSILLGAAINRQLVARFESSQIIVIGVSTMALGSAQLALIGWLGSAPLAWLWSCVCLFMFSIALIIPNATVIALDPLPKIAGVASSIIGTLQNISGASGALLGAIIYDGSLFRSVIIMACAGLLNTTVLLSRKLIVPHGIVHHPDELARD